mmetsp:Transcript_48939/g.156529  ORF Transcript_48939/g.156529 Transcript_48939/m.156529 type:complete len:322 (+) Transcript_48939:147-1112(+)
MRTASPSTGSLHTAPTSLAARYSPATVPLQASSSWCRGFSATRRRPWVAPGPLRSTCTAAGVAWPWAGTSSARDRTPGGAGGAAAPARCSSKRRRNSAQVISRSPSASRAWKSASSFPEMARSALRRQARASSLRPMRPSALRSQELKTSSSKALAHPSSVLAAGAAAGAAAALLATAGGVGAGRATGRSAEAPSQKAAHSEADLERLLGRIALRNAEAVELANRLLELAVAKMRSSRLKDIYQAKAVALTGSLGRPGDFGSDDVIRGLARVWQEDAFEQAVQCLCAGQGFSGCKWNVASVSDYPGQPPATDARFSVHWDR